MPPRNPSELARLEDEYQYWMAKVLNHSLSKSSKAEALVEVRKLEKLLGIEGNNYNNNEFGK